MRRPARIPAWLWTAADVAGVVVTVFFLACLPWYQHLPLAWRALTAAGAVVIAVGPSYIPLRRTRTGSTAGAAPDSRKDR